LKPGYKETEVGVIPENWEAQPITNVTHAIFLGLTSKVDYVSNGGIPLVRASDIASGRLSFFEARSISVRQHRELTRYRRAKRGDVLVSKSGSLGVCAIVDVDTEFSIYESIIVLQPTELLDSSFLLSILRHEATQARMIGEKVGSTVGHLNLQIFRKLVLAIPPVSEQRAIATALSDVDWLLGGLNRLIAKKRDLKQAAMQQLLTGQTRLPGFQDEWMVKRLKQVAEISTGINKPLNEMGSGALYVTVQDLYDGTSIRTGRLSRIKVSPNEIEAKSLVVGDIVFGKSSVKRDGIGYPSQFRGCGEPVVFSGFTYRARARQGIADAAFLFYALRTEKTRRWLIDNSQASALTNINQTIADAIPISMPHNVPEQTAIAAVLTDTDAELAALEQRREKTRALKQAMMQELLTGRTRLVSPKQIHA
jgi:type I restriction enzyme, S subunit